MHAESRLGNGGNGMGMTKTFRLTFRVFSCQASKGEKEKGKKRREEVGRAEALL